MAKPRTIHDFGEFPPALYQLEYPALGSPNIAKHINVIVQKTSVTLDQDWTMACGVR